MPVDLDRQELLDEERQARKLTAEIRELKNRLGSKLTEKLFCDSRIGTRRERISHAERTAVSES